MKIKITWEVEDGYVGKSRPQHSVFDSDDYMDVEEWEALSNEAKDQRLQDFIQEQFETTISWSILEEEELF